MALYSMQDTRQDNKILHVQAAKAYSSKNVADKEIIMQFDGIKKEEQILDKNWKSGLLQSKNVK